MVSGETPLTFLSRIFCPLSSLYIYIYVRQAIEIVDRLEHVGVFSYSGLLVQLCNVLAILFLLLLFLIYMMYCF